MRKQCRLLTYAIFFLLIVHLAYPQADSTDYFRITVIDVDTQRGVPLVELKTLSNLLYYTDSALYEVHRPNYSF